jgi:hypothetical protein
MPCLTASLSPSLCTLSLKVLDRSYRNLLQGDLFWRARKLKHDFSNPDFRTLNSHPGQQAQKPGLTKCVFHRPSHQDPGELIHLLTLFLLGCRDLPTGTESTSKHIRATDSGRYEHLQLHHLEVLYSFSIRSFKTTTVHCPVFDCLYFEKFQICGDWNVMPPKAYSCSCLAKS